MGSSAESSASLEIILDFLLGFFCYGHLLTCSGSGISSGILSCSSLKILHYLVRIKLYCSGENGLVTIHAIRELMLIM